MDKANTVSIAKRFQRAIRIDADLGDVQTLKDYICPESSMHALQVMSGHVDSGQTAFTITGPYGSGKSSLVVALATLLQGDGKLSRHAKASIGKETASIVLNAFSPKAKPWKVLPIVGQYDQSIVEVLDDKISESGFCPKRKAGRRSERKVLETIVEAANSNPRSASGLAIFIDEMGMFLNAAAGEGRDISFFQHLAELAARSNNRLVVIGVLHQAFSDYARGLSQNTRNEWSKIQGRYVDITAATSRTEQIYLMGQAIRRSGKPTRGNQLLAKKVAGHVQGENRGILAHMLCACAPLHPIAACLIGPMSMSRFGQSQRSVFGFLNSSEPCGFQEFTQSPDKYYTPDKLWDYLHINLETSIMASLDGHRWAVAAEAVSRCESANKKVELQVLKTIAIMDMFKEQSKLKPSKELLELSLPPGKEKEINAALRSLQKKSLAIYRRYTQSYAVYEGSDFDIGKAIKQANEEIIEINYETINELAQLKPIVAKRHYHSTGAMRVFDFAIVPLEDLCNMASSYKLKSSAVGVFILAIPTKCESKQEINKTCKDALKLNISWPFVVGVSPSGHKVAEIMRELLAVEKVANERPELHCDRIARSEVHAHISHLRGQVDQTIEALLAETMWHRNEDKPQKCDYAGLNSLASDIADDYFNSSPVIHSELLNRENPSGSAVAAQNILLRNIVGNEGKVSLAINGYPAERGLLESLLISTKLYRKESGSWKFISPNKNDDSSKLSNLWETTTEYLEENSNRPVKLAEIYDIWQKPPFGVRRGLFPVLITAFLLTNRSSIAFYREGMFQTKLTDLDVDFLVKRSGDIEVRWMEFSVEAHKLLSSISEVVGHFNNSVQMREPIDIARGLVAIYDGLPLLVRRTHNISSQAKKLRQLLKDAKDPNKLIFDDLPSIFCGKDAVASIEDADIVTRRLKESVVELHSAYRITLESVCNKVLKDLEVPNAMPASLNELHERAKNIRNIGNDRRIEAFIVRMESFKATESDIEGLISLAVNKPPSDWTDDDIEQASLELARMAFTFNRAEIFAYIKNRKSKRRAMGVVIGMGNKFSHIHDEFDVLDTDKERIDGIIKELHQVLDKGPRATRSIILAALAELTAHHLKKEIKEEIKPKQLAGSRKAS